MSLNVLKKLCKKSLKKYKRECYKRNVILE